MEASKSTAEDLKAIEMMGKLDKVVDKLAGNSGCESRTKFGLSWCEVLTEMVDNCCCEMMSK